MKFDKLVQQIRDIDEHARRDTARAVNIGLTLLRSAVRGDDENLRARLAALDELNPLFNLSRLRTFARLPDDEIDGGCAEE